MVNWCENEITISGDRDMIERLWSLMQARNEFLNVLYPRPERIKANDIERWNEDNWGTKWDIDGAQIASLELHVCGCDAKIEGRQILTACDPPIKAFENALLHLKSIWFDKDDIDIKCKYSNSDFEGLYDYCEDNRRMRNE